MIDWQQRLFHLRFFRLLLFLDKFFSIAFVAFFAIFFSPQTAILAAAFTLFQHVALLTYVQRLEQAAGMPVSSLAICVA